MEFVFVIVGVVFFGVGIFLVIDHRKFQERAYKVRGKVVGIERYVSTSGSGSNRSRSTYYRPVVEYVAQGNTYRFNHTGGRESIKHKLNQTVPVLVARDNPADARLDSNHIMVMGVVFALVGLGLLIAFPFVYEFSWYSVGIGVFILGSIAVTVFRIARKFNFRSLRDLKLQIREANLAGKLAGSAEDPLLINREGSDTVLFKTPQEVRQEKRRIARIERIILLIFLVLGLVLVWFGWGIYEKEMARAHPDEIKAYAMLAFGGLFVLVTLPRLVKRLQ
jgi:hypothetical protein